jgi:two-component system response regulator YesN
MIIMVVEDDPLIRKGIKTKLPYEYISITSVMEAKDGIDALEKFEQQPPDIVLVDYMMPRMNGLEFVKRAKVLSPETEFVLLTCMHDYEMAKEAILLGVSSLLNKSTVDMDILSGVIIQLAKKQEQQRRQKAQFSEMDSLKLRQEEELFRQLLNGHISLEDYEQIKLEKRAFFGRSPYAAWVIALDNELVSEQSFTEALGNRTGTNLFKLAKELYPHSLIGWVAEDSKIRWRLLLSTPIPKPMDIVEAAMSKFNLHIFVSCSETFPSPLQWPIYNNTAEQNMLLKWYGGDHPPVFTSSQMTAHLQNDLAEQIRAMKLNIQKLHFAEVLQAWPALIAYFRKSTSLPYPHAVCKSLEELVIFLYHSIEPFTSDLHVMRKAEQDVLTHINQAGSLQEALKAAYKEIQWVNDNIFLDQQAKQRKHLIESIKQYVLDHPYNTVTLYDVAERYHLNTSYLSQVFKKEAGVTFSDYIQHVKIELAENMLKNGQRVSMVAETLGYLNISSFTRMYKKVKGFPPSSFKSS